MRKLIEQLKAELEKAQAQNNRFRAVIKKLKEELSIKLIPSKDGKISEQHQAMQNTVKALEDILNSSEIAHSDDGILGGKSSESNGRVDSKIFYEDSELDESALNNANTSGGDALMLSPDAKIPPSQFSGKRSSV